MAVTEEEAQRWLNEFLEADARFSVQQLARQYHAERPYDTLPLEQAIVMAEKVLDAVRELQAG